MSTQADRVEDYAYLWRGSTSPHRWVIWTTDGETMVFDRKINCPVDVDMDGEATLREVLRRMCAAGVPVTDEYPGRPCGAGGSGPW